MLKPHLSVSAMNMLFRCGIQYEQRYVFGRKVPPGVALIIGKSVDASVNLDLNHKIAAHTLLDADVVTDAARDAVKGEWERGYVLDGDYAEMSPAKAKAEAIDTSVGLARLHHFEVAPELEPTHVQRQWAIEIPALGIDLVGIIDIQEGTRSVLDTKTSGKKTPTQDDVDKSLQLTTYAMAVKVCDGVMPAEVGINALIRLKRENKAAKLRSKRTEQSFSSALERIARAHKIIQAGLFTPAPIDAWWCDARFCGYHATCPYAAHPVTIPVSGEKHAEETARD